MIAKLVVWGADRQAALDKMSQKLSEYRVVGLPTNIQFLKRCAESDAFQAAGAELDTGFIDRNEQKLLPKVRLPTMAEVAQAAMALTYKVSFSYFIDCLSGLVYYQYYFIK